MLKSYNNLAYSGNGGFNGILLIALDFQQQDWKLDCHCGDYSFSIMLLHFLAFKAVNLLQCLMYDYPLERIAEFPCINYLSMEWMGLYILAGCTLPIALSKLYEMILLHVFNIFKRNK